MLNTLRKLAAWRLDRPGRHRPRMICAACVRPSAKRWDSPAVLPRYLRFFVSLLFVPAVCWANVGIPLGTYSFAWTVLFLVPIVFAEGWVLRSDLGLSYRRALGTATPSNILSTLAGVAAPVLTAPLMAAPGAVSDAWTLVLFVPLFYLSRTIEFAYSRWSLNGLDQSNLKRAVHRANLLSYAMLSIFVVARFFKAWYVNGQIVW